MSFWFFHPLQLPLNSKDESYELRVTGHAEDEILFYNSTPLSFEIKRVSVVIQTDKLLYKPGQEVKFRVIMFSSDFRPYKASLDVFIKVSGKDKVSSNYLSKASLEALLLSLALSCLRQSPGVAAAHMGTFCPGREAGEPG